MGAGERDLATSMATQPPSWIGDRSDFAREVSPLLPRLRAFAVAMGLGDQAEDVMQNSLMNAWIKREQFDPDRGTVATWLLAILANEGRRTWRRRLDVSVPLEQVATVLDGAITNVDLQRAINSLPRQQRVAIVLYHYVDLPVSDIATVLGKSTGTIKSTLHDARRNLADRLGVSYAKD